MIKSYITKNDVQLSEKNLSVRDWKTVEYSETNFEIEKQFLIIEIIYFIFILF